MNLDTLCNICSTIYDYFGDLSKLSKDNEDELLIMQGIALTRILGTLGLWFNFTEMAVTLMDEDGDVKITPKMAKRLFPYKFRTTVMPIADSTIAELENMLNEEFEPVASSMYPLFDAIGYVLKEEEGRWRLREAMHEYSYTDGMESN